MRCEWRFEILLISLVNCFIDFIKKAHMRRKRNKKTVIILAVQS